MTLAQLSALIERYIQEQEILDARTALVCAVIANCFRNPKKKIKPFQPVDFMPQRKKQEQTPEEMKGMLQMVTKMMGGEVHG